MSEILRASDLMDLTPLNFTDLFAVSDYQANIYSAFAGAALGMGRAFQILIAR